MAGNNEIPPLKVELNTFIPQQSVDAPLWMGTFSGDNRSVGQTGTHRTQHTINVESDPSRNPPYRVSIGVDIGETHKLDENGKTIKTATAPRNELSAEQWKVDKDGSIVVDLSGNGKNPLVTGAPGITYDMELRLKPNANGTWSVNAKGTHDEFPGYEVIAKVGDGQPVVVHGYDPREHDNGPMNLAQGTFLWPSQVRINTGKTVGPNGLVAGLDQGGFEITPSRPGELHKQAYASLGDLGLTEEQRARIAPQFVAPALQDKLASIDSISETRGDTLTAVSVNAANPLDTQRITLDKEAALAKAPEVILQEAADLRAQSASLQVEPGGPERNVARQMA